MKPSKNILLRAALLWLGILLSACSAAADASPTTPPVSASPTAVSATQTGTPGPAPTPTATVLPPTAQPRLTALPSGPDLEDFPPGTNPLTGLRLQDRAMLELPAVLVSISNMPPTARPQAGTSFAAWIYELFISEGSTRFMAVFYGDLPRRIPNAPGDCPARAEIFEPQGAWIGNRVWLDENQDAEQDPWEAGVGGICVNLLEADSGQIIASTGSDSNGYYALDASQLAAQGSYLLEFKLPTGYRFSPANVGNDDQDSDVDPLNGRTRVFGLNEVDAAWDAGLVPVNLPAPTYAASDIAPERTYVGPIRSGRLTYNDFVRMYPAGCLVYASASDSIREQLEGCEIIFGEQPGKSPNTALLDTSYLKELAQKSKIDGQPVNYSGHLFDPAAPQGGLPAASLWTYFHAYSQALWQYDPVSGSYLRQTDDGDGRGVFHPDTDRLTGRQLAFENLAILTADYKIFRYRQYDIELCCGVEGYAFVFRDGQMYRVRWSTNNRAWEQKSGLLRPLHFITADKQPFALKPGRTWVSIMTLNSALRDLKDGKWQAIFGMPDDPAPKN